MTDRPIILPYPDDEHDQLDDFNDLGLKADLNMLSRAVVDRRRVLSLGMAGIATLVAGSMGLSRAAALAQNAASCVPATPSETAGPYPADGSRASGQSTNVLTRSGIVRSDLHTSLGTKNKAAGVPLTLKMTLVDVNKSCAPLAGYAVYAWHCTADGQYSMYTSDVIGEDYLRGVQATGKDGTLTFTTIFPGCYAGRWPHVHFEVFPTVASATAARSQVLTSQIALPETTCRAVYATPAYGESSRNLTGTSLERDMVFRDGYASQMAKVTGDASKGYIATITVGLAR
ncbi:intradiol ring-cleavage dioxygenase [Deinococcus yavapaiensis]|uniref:Protocatechuate 3,4-dioxygenase beta subunit n=1 Tax=Deinococcus yavapaiensis KR-236 TaxID=694435 RepID=A0A318S305_9DEIO|nr:intradiol ring-cleavage dioxygenase [Deinococcus yavapaiensis]PYE51204.1 protocatechuate 3,4-dioxygenase beta subunit [Deinococcus yavapaiensis KR-236]